LDAQRSALSEVLSAAWKDPPHGTSSLAGKLLVSSPEEQKTTMLHWSLVFLVIAIIAALLGFGGIAGTAAGIAKILFFVFLVVWLLALIMGRRSV
jgi:uncharacterized membrane protein YtjA (UPF0391 family)